MEYKGHKYEIIYCDPKDDWGTAKGKFHIKCAIKNSGYYDTYREAESTAKKIIDNFVSNIPQTKQEWLNAMSSCMVWNGYEDCHIDEAMVWDLLKKARQYLSIE